MIKFIIKRNGQKDVFDKNKIMNAIIKAMKACNVDDIDCAIYISNSINDSINSEYIKIEDIQDMVEEHLMKTEYPNVAKEYIKYREKRINMRNREKSLREKVKDIIFCKNIKNLNANVDERSFGGRQNESSNIVHKDIALYDMIDPEVTEHHNIGAIHMHDLDKYDIGMHNCLFANVSKLLTDGFYTKNGGVKGANSLDTAAQLLAVIFQSQSQDQFGGVASSHIDFDLAPFVKISFAKHLKKGLRYVENKEDEIVNIPRSVCIEDEDFKQRYPKAFKYATDMINEEAEQAAQSIYHNLNTLESRPGNQVPFSSLNFGRDTSPEGRLVSFALMNASIEGIGKEKSTPIFPITIFQYKKGVNDVLGTPNYDLKLKAIESLTKRMFPNFINCDFSGANEDINDIDTYFSSMGCRTFVGYDRHGLGYSRIGRGNICPITMNLVRIGIRHGIVTGEREVADIKGFWDELYSVLRVTEKGLIDRFTHICEQSVSSARFMYGNGTVADSDKANEKGIYEAMKHSSLAFGYIGIAEMCQSLFGKNHSQSEEVHAFALSVVKAIYDYSVDCSSKYDLNFVAYATPAENLCKRFSTMLQKEFGKIENVTDKEYITNSHHVPVWEKVSQFKKIDLEKPFGVYATGGCITYTEFSYTDVQNTKAVENNIDYAMSNNIPYNSINFPIDRCTVCNHVGKIENCCPKCNSTKIFRLRKITGYLTTDMENFNPGKKAEVTDRVVHSQISKF